jgi:hypothetical protein
MSTLTTLAELESAIRASWSTESCDPVDRAEWSVDNPSRGQCGVTSLLLCSVLGGVLVEAEVFRDGQQVEYHYWNRLPSGLELDLTRAQFRRGELLTPTRDLEPQAPGPRMAREYDALVTAVTERLPELGQLLAERPDRGAQAD